MSDKACSIGEQVKQRILALLDSPEMAEAVSEVTWNFDNEHDHGMGEWGDTNKRRFPQYCAEEASRSKAVLTKIKDMINE